MREYLRQYFMYGQPVIIDVEIIKFGKFCFDGSDNLIPFPYAENTFSPIIFDTSKASDFLNLPIRYKTKTTLLKPLCILDQPEYLFDESDHFWLPDDLSKYGYRKGSKLQIMGHVSIYQRSDKSDDFCLDPNSVMLRR